MCFPVLCFVARNAQILSRKRGEAPPPSLCLILCGWGHHGLWLRCFHEPPFQEHVSSPERQQASGAWKEGDLLLHKKSISRVFLYSRVRGYILCIAQKHLLYSEHRAHTLYSLRLVELKVSRPEQHGPMRIVTIFVLMLFGLQSSVLLVYIKPGLAGGEQRKRNQIRIPVCTLNRLCGVSSHQLPKANC